MGNFISNQRIESMGDEENAKWTERGVLMDVTIKKKDGKTTIGTAKAHPTWVNRTPNQREPFHQKDIPCIITKLIFWKIL
ncbi:CapA domain-containing protein [Streptococcus pneumoniae]|nr:CapA domain-containing protein [Streptococcus pneumoniae]